MEQGSKFRTMLHNDLKVVNVVHAVEHEPETSLAFVSYTIELFFNENCTRLG